MKSLQNSSKLQNKDENMYISLVQHLQSEKNPKDTKIQKSLVNLSNKILELEEIASRLDHSIHRS